MHQKDDIELGLAAVLKAARSAVRLRHSLAADAELNEVIPLLEREYNASVARGILPAPAEMLREFNVLHDSE